MLVKSSKKWIAVIVVLMSVLLIAVACGDDDAAATPTSAPDTPTPSQPVEQPSPTAEATPTPRPFEGQSIIWSAYSGPFYDTIAKTVIPSFEEKTGATIDLVPGAGDELINILAAPADNPPYDGIFGYGPDHLRGIEEDVLLPLRRENIPNLNDITDFHASDFGEGRDINYGAPFEFGYGAMVYNKELLGFTPTGWDAFWEPEAQGKIGLSTTYWFFPISAAALALDLEPGLDEIYSPEGFDAVIAKLQELEVAFWWQAGAESASAFERNDIAIDVAATELGHPLVVQNPDKYGFLLPEEGTMGFIDYMMIPKGTRNRDLAEAFINHALDPEVQTAFAEEVAYFMSNKNTRYGPIASQFLPPTAGEMEERAILLKWGYLLDHWTEYEDRLKRDVFTQ